MSHDGDNGKGEKHDVDLEKRRKQVLPDALLRQIYEDSTKKILFERDADKFLTEVRAWNPLLVTSIPRSIKLKLARDIYCEASVANHLMSIVMQLQMEHPRLSALMLPDQVHLAVDEMDRFLRDEKNHVEGDLRTDLRITSDYLSERFGIYKLAKKGDDWY